MDFSEIASVSGKGGLYKVLTPTRTGVILESLDEKKSKLVAGMQSRISVLKEISIFTTDQDGAVALEEVLRKMHAEFGDDLGVDTQSDTEELRAFVKHVLPNYDQERVYPSDMKKLVAWYYILLKEVPEVFASPAEEKTDK
jgi:hypothetical protein